MKLIMYFSIALFGLCLGLHAYAQHGVVRGSLSGTPASSLPDSVQHVRSRALSQAAAGTADSVQTSRRIIFTKEAPAPIGPYSQAVVVQGNLAYTAGQIPIVPATGEVVVGDIKVQTKQVLENLKAVLEAAGSGLQHVVKTTVYVVDMREFGAMNEIYSQYFAGSPPARTTVEVSRLPRDVRVEIEAVGLVVHK